MSDIFDRAPGQRFQQQGAPAGPPAGWNGVPPATPSGGPFGGTETLPPVGLGAPGEPTPRQTVERYRTTPWWASVGIGVIVLAVIVALVWFGTRPPAPAGQATPSATPTTTQSTRTPPPGGQGLPFEARVYNATGYWEILSYAWDATGVTITCRITVDKGTLRYSWLALDNTSSRQYGATRSASTLYSGTVAAPDSVTGTIRFDKNRSLTTVYLADARGVQISALSVDA